MGKLTYHLVLLAGLQLLGGPLFALEIGDLDGQWCSPEGQAISVSGTAIIAPNGRRTTGAYSEHALSFTVAGEPGTVTWMEPVGRNSARVSIVSAVQREPPPHDLWTRCRVTSKNRMLRVGATLRIYQLWWVITAQTSQETAI